MKILESKRSKIGIIAEFCGILNGFPNLVIAQTPHHITSCHITTSHKHTGWLLHCLLSCCLCLVSAFLMPPPLMTCRLTVALPLIMPPSCLCEQGTTNNVKAPLSTLTPLLHEQGRTIIRCCLQRCRRCCCHHMSRGRLLIPRHHYCCPLTCHRCWCHCTSKGQSTVPRHHCHYSLACCCRCHCRTSKVWPTMPRRHHQHWCRRHCCHCANKGQGAIDGVKAPLLLSSFAPQSAPQYHQLLSCFPYIGGPNLDDCRFYHTIIIMDADNYGIS